MQQYVRLIMLTNGNADIDECSEGISGCSQLCTNIIGSYYCTCLNGYQLSNDNHTCSDIDECTSDNGGCEQTCTNTNGSYYCSCLTGYLLDNNNHNCSGITIFSIFRRNYFNFRY